jgi:hypothetical protein
MDGQGIFQGCQVHGPHCVGYPSQQANCICISPNLGYESFVQLEQIMRAFLDGVFDLLGIRESEQFDLPKNNFQPKESSVGLRVALALDDFSHFFREALPQI